MTNHEVQELLLLVLITILLAGVVCGFLSRLKLRAEIEGKDKQIEFLRSQCQILPDSNRESNSQDDPSPEVGSGSWVVFYKIMTPSFHGLCGRKIEYGCQFRYERVISDDSSSLVTRTHPLPDGAVEVSWEEYEANSQHQLK